MLLGGGEFCLLTAHLGARAGLCLALGCLRSGQGLAFGKHRHLEMQEVGQDLHVLSLEVLGLEDDLEVGRFEVCGEPFQIFIEVCSH
jgi:hypothetical protein